MSVWLLVQFGEWCCGMCIYRIMFRVQLRIEKVSMRVREPVELRVLIRKDHRFFAFCPNQPLRDAELKLSHTAEFLVDAKSPRFQIQLLLLSGETRKKGGVVPINLKSFAINATHSSEQQIRKTPLSTSTLTLQLTYMKSEYSLEENLVSMSRLEELIAASRVEGGIDEHQRLVFRNNSLANQVEELQKTNAALQEQHHALQDSMQEKNSLFKEDMQLIERTQQQASSGNDENKRRVAQLVQDIQNNNEKGKEQAASKKD